MAVTNHQKLNYLFSFIAGISLATALFITSTSIRLLRPDWTMVILAFSFVVCPLFIEAFGAIGLVLKWFYFQKIHSGHVVNFLQWIAGILGIAAVFDFTVRFTRKSIWMMQDMTPFVVDIIFVFLFIAWMFVSYLISKDSRESGKCRFC